MQHVEGGVEPADWQALATEPLRAFLAFLPPPLYIGV